MSNKLIKFVTIEEYLKMIDYTKRSNDKLKKVYLLAIILGFEAGMRISEIIGLPNKDGSWIVPPLISSRVDLKTHMIRIEQGKGKKDRVVPVPKAINEASLKFLPINSHISRRSLQRYVTNLGKKLFDKKISFHSLRHGFGSHLASSGRPLHEIQMLMGHSDLSTTGIYLHANPVKAVEGARDVF